MTFACIMITFPFLCLISRSQTSLRTALTFQHYVPVLYSNVFILPQQRPTLFLNLSWEFSQGKQYSLGTMEKHWGQKGEREKGKVYLKTIGLLLDCEDSKQEGNQNLLLCKSSPGLSSARLRVWNNLSTMDWVSMVTKLLLFFLLPKRLILKYRCSKRSSAVLL